MKKKNIINSKGKKTVKKKAVTSGMKKKATIKKVSQEVQEASQRLVNLRLKKQLEKYKELEKVYTEMYKELNKLGKEKDRLKKEVKEIINKTKVKNILQDIINQPE